MTTEISNTDQNAKHTPGPWRWLPMFDKSGKRHSPEFSIHSDTLMVGNVEPCASMTVQESQANARLIAAAPDMLKALELASQYIDTELHATVLKHIRSVIVSATGAA